jgi:GT2 family glycosyltransferase
MTNEQGSNSSPLPGEASSPLVVISILNWNGWRDTLKCLQSVRELDYPNYLIVVVDNGSGNDSADRIGAWARENLKSGCASVEYSEEAALGGGEEQAEAALDRAPSAQRLVLIRNKENRGFAGGHNVAIHYALARKQVTDDVFLLNNDSVVSPDGLARLISVQQSARAGIVGAIVTEKENPRIRLEGPFSFRASFFAPFIGDRAESGTREKPYRYSDFVIGTAMLIGRDVLASIGGSSGDYLPSRLFFSGEEQAFCFAAKKRNFVIVMAEDVCVEHLGGRSAGGKGSTLMYYYGQRNSVLLAKMLLPFHYRILFYSLNLSLAAGRVGKNLLRRRPHAVWAVIHGVLDGYLGRTGKWKYHDREAAASG